MFEKILEKFLDELSTGWIWMAIPVIVLGIWRFYQQRFKKRYIKLVLFKVIRLRLKNLGQPPYYFRKHHSLEDIEEPVYDETWVINGTIANQPTILEPITVTSSGSVDAYQILPSISISKDIHPHRKDDPKEFQFKEETPSRSIAVIGVLTNGIQDEKEWWYGSTAQYNEQDITLIVDFSSLPNAENLIKQVTGTWVSQNHPGSKGKISEIPVAINPIGKDIFSVLQKNCHLNDVVKIKFQLDDREMESMSTRN